MIDLLSQIDKTKALKLKPGDTIAFDNEDNMYEFGVFLSYSERDEEIMCIDLIMGSTEKSYNLASYPISKCFFFNSSDVTLSDIYIESLDRC